MAKVRLYFPDIETGQVSVGYSTVDIVNHVAEIDGAEAEAIAYWQQTAGATFVPFVQGAHGSFTIGPDDDLGDDELPIGAQQ